MLSKYTYLALALACFFASCQRVDEKSRANTPDAASSTDVKSGESRDTAVVMASGCSGESCGTGLRILSGKYAGSSCMYKEGLLGQRGDTLLITPVMTYVNNLQCLPR